MCGICGVLHFEAQHLDKKDQRLQTLKAMTQSLVHRGPDMAGDYLDDFVSLGFRRLTIIDLSPCGNQPLYSNDGRYVLVFNGEIYNYKALRRELEALGAHFVSHTDSEVLVHGYHFWGESLVSKLRGMFAFAIWDRNAHTLFLARDPFGIKPLYITKNTEDGAFLFSSEIKSFLNYPKFQKGLNPQALMPYLSFQYSAPKETFFEGVYKVLPGHSLCLKVGAAAQGMAAQRAAQPIACGDDLIQKPYFHCSFAPSEASIEEKILDIRASIESSVKLHLQSDVPVGTFLSSGVDSSFITSIVRPEHSFSVGFASEESGEFNETYYAEQLAQQIGTKHHNRIISGEDCLRLLPKIQYAMDEPHGNFSALPLYFLAELAREYVTVVLSGEGADELFGGYDRYRESRYAERYLKLPFALRQALAKIAPLIPSEHHKKAIIRMGQKPRDYFIGEMDIYSREGASHILKPAYRSGPSAWDFLSSFYDQIDDESTLNQKQLVDLNFWLPSDILLKADKMSSAHSLELRVPYLDLEVYESARKLKETERVRGLSTKYALRQASAAYLPESSQKRPKMGFMTPLRKWLREDAWYQSFKKAFQSDLCAEFFDSSALLKMLEAHHSGQALYQHELYLPYVFLVWYEQFFA